MLALRTGWTPQVIGGDAPDGISDRFRQAAHFALYAETLSPIYDDALRASVASAPSDAPMDLRAAVARERLEGTKELGKLRRLLELEVVDG